MKIKNISELTPIQTNDIKLLKLKILLNNNNELIYKLKNNIFILLNEFSTFNIKEKYPYFFLIKERNPLLNDSININNNCHELPFGKIYFLYVKTWIFGYIIELPKFYYKLGNEKNWFIINNNNFNVDSVNIKLSFQNKCFSVYNDEDKSLLFIVTRKEENPNV